MRVSTIAAGFAVMALTIFSTLPSYGQRFYSSGQASNSNEQATQTTTLSLLETKAQQTISTFKQKDPSLKKFFSESAGYAVFPTVGEGGFIVGGAHGKGIVYQNGVPMGEATLTKSTVGAQLGGESFSELVFFQDSQSLQKFKQGNLEFSAGLSAVVANSGVGATANYRNGVAVFTTSRSGLMAKATIGGQKFTYEPVAAMGAGGFHGMSGTNSGSSSNLPAGDAYR